MSILSLSHKQQLPAVDIENFLLSDLQPKGNSAALHRQHLPSTLEIYQCLTSPVHQLSALLSRDKRFAAANVNLSFMSVQISVLELISGKYNLNFFALGFNTCKASSRCEHKTPNCRYCLTFTIVVWFISRYSREKLTQESLR